TPSAVPGRLHDPDAAARHEVLRRHARDAPGAPLVALRHAPPALGAAARSAALLRALLRDVAAVGAQPERPQGASAVDARSGSVQRAVPDRGAAPNAEADGRRALPGGVRPGAFRRRAPRYTFGKISDPSPRVTGPTKTRRSGSLLCTSGLRASSCASCLRGSGD